MGGMSGMGAGGGPVLQGLMLVAFAALATFYAARANQRCLAAHAPHLLMALGMLYMVLPVAWQVLPLSLWLATFGAASAWCVARTAGRWQRDHHLDLEFAHSELAGCVAMTVMLPLFTAGSLVGALPLAIALGTYFLAYSVFWAWRMRGRAPGFLGASAIRHSRVEALAQMTMGAGMAYMFLVM